MGMKYFLTVAILYLAPNFSYSQFSNVIIEEIDNEGKVPGRTYRIYAGLTNIKDQVYVLFGDSIHPLEIKSTKPFFQASNGSGLSKNINRKAANENDSLKYDSWITIGAKDNYDNNVSALNVNLDNFETNGGSISIPKDGAWFCIPTDKQGYCGEDKRILLMQLTTLGEIDGKFSIMGKSAAGVAYTTHDVTFKCGQSKKK